MNLDEIRKYSEWIGKKPSEILSEAQRLGGWTTIFPGELPIFAHQVRNYFNVEPTTLTRYPADHGDEFVARVQERFKKWGFTDRFKAVMALSGDVYKDNANRTWYQMSPGGTIYHWGGEPTWDVADAWSSNYLRGQDDIPIFKLVSPDGSGGSIETIIANNGRSVIGEVNKPEPVSKLISRDYHHQGSYNYSETVESGLAAHERHDVAPHKKYPAYYVNPPDRFASLSARQFPERNREGKLIGYEKGFEPFEFDSTRPDPPRGRVKPVTITDPFGDLMALRYPANHPGSSERVKKLEELFSKTGKPKRLLKRIEARADQAAKDFHHILHPASISKLLKILRERPAGVKDPA